MSDVSSGWGRFTWGQAYWNRDALLATGWGAKAWNDGEWGNLADETVSLFLQEFLLQDLLVLYLQ